MVPSSGYPPAVGDRVGYVQFVDMALTADFLTVQYLDR